MTTAIQPTDEALWAVVASGDLSRLNPQQKVAYYRARCEAAGLDYRAQPFQFLRLQGKEVLYATKAASDQLAAIHGIRQEIVSQSTDDGIRVVTVRAIAKDGRQTDEIGAVPVKGLSGEALCNAMMKAVTKAKRRAVLSVCGLGMMDETEVESIPAAVHVEPVPALKAVEEPKQLPAQGPAVSSALDPAAVEELTKPVPVRGMKSVGEALHDAIPPEAASLILAISVAASRQDLNRLGKDIRNLPADLQAQAREAFNTRSKEIAS